MFLKKYILCPLINVVLEQCCLIKLKTAWGFFWGKPWSPFLLETVSDIGKNFCCCGDRGENSTSAFTSYFILLWFWLKQCKCVFAAGSGTGTVLSCHCHRHGGRFPTLTLLPGRPTVQRFLLATLPFFLALWGQPSRLRQLLSLLPQLWALQQFMPYIRKLISSLQRQKPPPSPERFAWASGWQQGAVYRKPNLVRGVEEGLSSRWLSQGAAVVSSEHPVETGTTLDFLCMSWRTGLWISLQ